MGDERQTAKKRIEPSSVLAALFVAAVVVGVPLFLWSTCSGTSPLREETQVFFTRIRTGQIQQAYASLASSRRRELSIESFRAELERPVYRGHGVVDIDATQSSDEGWGCTRGELEMGGRDWSFEMYLVVENQEWRVHTWVVDEPATFAALNKLDQCQQW